MSAPAVFHVTADGLEIEVQFFSPEIVRILKYPAGNAVEKRSFAVVMQPEPCRFALKEAEGRWLLTGDALQLEIAQADGRVRFLTPEGGLLLAEKEAGTVFTPECYAGERTSRVRQAFRLDGDEALYGLGQHQTGRMNQRGQRLLLSQINMEIAIPFFLSLKGYGVYWDNASPTVFTDSVRETAFDSELGECADYYFLGGGSGDRVVANMRRLTGKAPMPPLWTLGYCQSKERYASQYELVAAVEKYRELGVPLDCIIQDWQYWGNTPELWNSMEFLNPAFPAPEKAVERIHELNAHVLISVWPDFGTETVPYREMKERNFLLGFGANMSRNGRNYDAWNPDARELFWKLLERHLCKAGVDGWWLDASEPEQPFPYTQNMWPTPDVFDTPTSAGSLRRVRNSYPLVHVEGVARRQKAADASKRVTILTRSAFAGQQRTGAFCWSGDVDSSWQALRAQIPAGLNLSMCGIPYWNTDIGGFFADREFRGGVAEPGFRELYVRWMQFGMFTPMMRSHGTFSPREIWQFGRRGDWAFDAIEACIRFRYRLLPYLYSTAWEVAKLDGSFLRPAALDDPALAGVGDEFRFGRALLAAPVVEPMYVKEGVTDFSRIGSRRVKLPAGKWFDFHTEEPVAGEVERPAPIDLAPLYVKAGSILPLGPEVQFSTEKPWDDLELRIYPGADGEFILYEDAFDGYGYEHGEHSEIRFLWNDAARTLTVEDRCGSYPGMLEQRRFRVRPVGGTEQAVTYGGEALTVMF